METTSPFDLNRAIQLWRKDLAQSPAFRSDNLDELESHLRDSVIVLQNSGLSEVEAFLIATRRCGQPEQLRGEFGKINVLQIWFFRTIWIIIGGLALLNGISLIQRVQRDFHGWDMPSHSFSYPVHVDLPAVAMMMVLVIAALNTFLLRRTMNKGNLGLTASLLNRSLLVIFSASIILACVATFQILCSEWLSGQSYNEYVAEQILSGIWFAYGFTVIQILVLALVVAQSCCTRWMRRRFFA